MLLKCACFNKISNPLIKFSYQNGLFFMTPPLFKSFLFNDTYHFRWGVLAWLLPLLWMWVGSRGNGMCQKRGRDFSLLPCGGKSGSLFINVSDVFMFSFLDLYLSEVSNEAAVSPRGKWLFERSQSLIFPFCRRRICRKGHYCQHRAIRRAGSLQSNDEGMIAVILS